MIEPSASILSICARHSPSIKSEDMTQRARDIFCDNISDEKTFKRECASLLKIRDAYPKLILANIHHPTCTYEGIEIYDLATWLYGHMVENRVDWRWPLHCLCVVWFAIDARCFLSVRIHWKCHEIQSKRTPKVGAFGHENLSKCTAICVIGLAQNTSSNT